MSFILDALKKSEHERQRQETPGLVQSTIARPRPRFPVWAIVLVVLLGVNLLLLTVVLTRGKTAGVAASTDRAAVMDQAVTAAHGPADASEKPFSPLDASQYAPEIPVTAVPDDASASQRGTAMRPPALAGTTPHAAHRKDPVLHDGDYQANEEEVLPSINEISLTGAQALPELHLDVHVFATQAAERFVFINMRKYHEGATLQEGPIIERIRRDGVILDYNGLRFLLPRQ